MSQAAVCKAIRDTLITAFSFPAPTEAYCTIKLDPSPDPNCGEFFITVHPGAWTIVQGDWDLHEEYVCGVTLTMRMGFSPQDRYGVAVWLDSADGANPAGLEPRLRTVITAIHHNQDVRNAANVYITGGTSGKIVTVPQLLRVDPPSIKYHDWFDAPQPETKMKTSALGVAQTVWFGKCQRCQDIREMD